MDRALEAAPAALLERCHWRTWRWRPSPIEARAVATPSFPNAPTPPQVLRHNAAATIITVCMGYLTSDRSATHIMPSEIDDAWNH